MQDNEEMTEIGKILAILKTPPRMRPTATIRPRPRMVHLTDSEDEDEVDLGMDDQTFGEYLDDLLNNDEQENDPSILLPQSLPSPPPSPGPAPSPAPFHIEPHEMELFTCESTINILNLL